MFLLHCLNVRIYKTPSSVSVGQVLISKIKLDAHSQGYTRWAWAKKIFLPFIPFRCAVEMISSQWALELWEPHDRTTYNKSRHYFPIETTTLFCHIDSLFFVFLPCFRLWGSFCTTRLRFGFQFSVLEGILLTYTADECCDEKFPVEIPSIGCCSST